MKTTKCNGLFPDEIMDILRDVRKSGGHINTEHGVYYPSAALLCDGVIHTDGGCWTVYTAGRRSGYVNTEYLVNVLAHSKFNCIGG